MGKATTFVLGCFAAALIAAAPAAHAQSPSRQAAARAIAKEAYIYGFPLVDSYRIQYAYFVDRGGPEYKAPWNQIFNNARVYTPEDRAIQTPNSDTPYSYIGADLRAEPLVLSVPAVEKGRYYSLQFIDMFTFNFAYVGSRATGNGPGRFLLAGPRWKGRKPSGIKAVIRSETDFVFVLYRTQLFNPGDIEKVKKIQAGYTVQPLSAFLGQPAPRAAPPIDFIKPLSADQERTSLQFFNVLNFVLEFCAPHPSEKAMMARFSGLSIGAGRMLDIQALSPEVRTGAEEGVAEAWQTLAVAKERLEAGKISSGELFGTRKSLKNNYLYRMLGAVAGIYGNSKEEAVYTAYGMDSAGQKLDAAGHRYTLRFAPGQLPPVNAFWSVTLYELPAQLLSANPLNRYLINSPMLPTLKRDADGGLTIYIQHESPGQGREANWLPAPSGPIMAALRLYQPKSNAQSGKWKAPPLQRAD
jgi:hypothetical protein